MINTSLSASVFSLIRVTVFALLMLSSTVAIYASDAVIHFDMPPTIVAAQLDSTDTGSGDSKLVRCDLRLSSLIASPGVPRIDQWLVRCQPRDPQVQIVDYTPRSEFASDIEGAIQVKISDEQSSGMGISLDGDYAKVAKGGLAADQATKHIESQQFNRIAPVQSVVASGSINRGRGVYFKLRWTAQQVLEGEKSFQLTLRVPQQWRGSLIDVSVVAETEYRSFGTNQTKTLGAAEFVVASHLVGDSNAAQLAHRVAKAEQSLHQLSHTCAVHTSPQSLPAMIRHVAAKLDLDNPRPSTNWVKRLLIGKADPYFDKEIARLPMEARVAAIEYCEARDDFKTLAESKL